MTTEQNLLKIGPHRRKERQRLEGLWWALVLIWAGMVFGADSLGFTPQIGEADAWSWVFLGAGAIAVSGSIYRVLTPNLPNPITWDWVWGIFCLIIGLGGFTSLQIAWPLFLILIGGAILLREFWRRD